MITCKQLLALFFTFITFLFGYQFGHRNARFTEETASVRCAQINAAAPLTQTNEKEIECEKNVLQNFEENFFHEKPKIHLHKLDGTIKGGVINGVFSMLNHPSVPVTTELIYTTSPVLSDDPMNSPYQNCESIYMTRTGTLQRMPNKCLAVAMIAETDTVDYSHSNSYVQSRRIGKVANNTNMYQPDYIDGFSLETEAILLPLFMRNIDSLIAQLVGKMGAPVDNGERKTLTILVANEGVVDLVLNFLCSCREAKIDTSRMIIFLGSLDLQPVMESMGVATFFHEALGPIPKKAANAYGDKTFGILMWLKTTSIYVASKAGYDILFQDADLVWIEDPLPYLKASIKDIAFMDDGARTPRFTPFFVNSGFYFQKHNAQTSYLMERMMKSICEISMTHSHQATLTRYITEAHHLMGLQITVLDQNDFPSGQVYHHNKAYIRDIKEYRIVPKVFHMCWTQSRLEKVTYFKDIGMWFLPSNTSDSFAVCNNPVDMVAWVNDNHKSGSGSGGGSGNLRGAAEKTGLLSKCCDAGDYWKIRQQQPKVV